MKFDFFVGAVLLCSTGFKMNFQVKLFACGILKFLMRSLFFGILPADQSTRKLILNLERAADLLLQEIKIQTDGQGLITKTIISENTP
jgi:hypothetical protein